MVHKQNELRSLVETFLLAHSTPENSLSCRELAQQLDRHPSHIAQVLRTLVIQQKVHCHSEKQSVDRRVRRYFHIANALLTPIAAPRKTCGSCQWFTAIHRCTLLDLIRENNPSLLPLELRKRALVEEIPRETPQCKYFEPWVPGQLKSRPFPRFIRENYFDGYFHCPIKRCRKAILEFSSSLKKILLGSNPFYCPHCGAPMEFGYDEHFDDYRVYYWDSHFDALKKSYHELTGDTLPERNPRKRVYGVSILKEGSFTIKKKPEVLFVGTSTTSERVIHSPDLTFFPLKNLNYIYTKSWDDYFYLIEHLHEEDPETNHKLYKNITIYPPHETIPSVEPLPKEVGGNELVILTGLLNVPSFKANLLTREALLEKKIQSVDADLMEEFTQALHKVKDYNKQFDHLQTLDSKQWQRLEGGCASLMFNPFKLEAQKYGFSTPSRKLSRMVRSERFLPYGLFNARSAYDSLVNGVNYVITSKLKREVYNDYSLAWDGLRGWCHQDYPHGLYLDTIDQQRTIALFCIHEAIRMEEITPNDFVLHRGKRYDAYYCVEAESEGYQKILRIALQALATKIELVIERSVRLKHAYEWYIPQQKELLNKLADYSVDLFLNEEGRSGKVLTVWKKLQQTKGKDILTSKELSQVHAFSRRFFAREFIFEPLAISEIC